jgi:hypothetical protein
MDMLWTHHNVWILFLEYAPGSRSTALASLQGPSAYPWRARPAALRCLDPDHADCEVPYLGSHSRKVIAGAGTDDTTVQPYQSVGL